MQRLISFAFLGIALLASQAARADRIVGNGGDLVTCTNAHFVLDVYEAKQMRGMTADFHSPGDPQDFYAKAKAVLERVAAVDPERGALYLQWLAEFPVVSRILPDQTFDDIKDSGNVVLQNSCRRLDQLAIQRQPENPEDSRYLINGDLWDQLVNEPDQRAALVVHEIVYRDALRRGHINSQATRYLVGLMAWEHFAEQINQVKWQERVRRNDFDAYVFYDPWTQSTVGHSKYLYFDRPPATRAEAQAFCESLGPDAGLPVQRDFDAFGGQHYAAWKASSLGKHLLGRATPPEIWLNNDYVITFDQNDPSEHDVGASGKAETICWIQD